MPKTSKKTQKKKVETKPKSEVVKIKSKVEKMSSAQRLQPHNLLREIDELNERIESLEQKLATK